MQWARISRLPTGGREPRYNNNFKAIAAEIELNILGSVQPRARGSTIDGCDEPTTHTHTQMGGRRGLWVRVVGWDPRSNRSVPQ
eukprot:3662340-Pyramimonas_sp.AAC.1